MVETARAEVQYWQHMDQASYTFFDTEIGRCGIVWKQRERGGAVVVTVTGFQLPEASDSLASARIQRTCSASWSEDIPDAIRKVIERVKQHFNGDTQDFLDVALEFDGFGAFAKQVYDAARTIPPGQTMTYGKLAKAAGHTGAARAVGAAMGKNPIPLIVPCHRVVAAGNKPGGFSAHGGLDTKARMLEIEGASIGGIGLRS